MSPLRLTVACLLFALSFDACSCTKPPVSQTLKPEGEACTDDEQCESSLCDKLPGQSQVCFRKCSQNCKQGEICTSLSMGDRYACREGRPLPAVLAEHRLPVPRRSLHSARRHQRLCA